MNGYEPADVFYPVPRGPAPETLGMRPPMQAGPAPPVGDPGFDAWYGGMSRKLGMDPNPDAREHFYNYRQFYRDMQAGKVAPPDAPGGHWPSTYKMEGHPRTFLDDTQGRVFDTRTARYLGGAPVPQNLLTASERSPDMPGYKPDHEVVRADAYATIAANPASEEAHAAREVLARLPKIQVGRGTGAEEPAEEPDHAMMVAQYMRGMR